MKLKILFTIFVFSVLALSAMANENSAEILPNKRVKERLIEHLQQSIARHSDMSIEEIQKELIIETNTKIQLLQQNGINADPNFSAIEMINKMDKEEILALETAQLQSALTSSSYNYGAIFGFTRREVFGGMPISPIQAIGTMLITVPLDLIFLPFALIRGIFTGEY